MKLVFSVCFVLICCQVSAQFAIEYFPPENSMVARNQVTGEGRVVFKFSVPKSLNSDSIYIKKYQDNVFSGIVYPAWSLVEELLQFDHTDTIFAGLHTYGYELWYGSNLLVRQSGNICAGDFYMLNGQSNAESRSNKDSCFRDYNNFIRTYGNATENGINMEWGMATGDGTRDSKGHIGQLGIAIAAELLNKHKIPVCIFNGAVGGMPIEYFLPGETHNDPYTAYGRLFNRIKEAGALGSIRAIIWYQGERDAGLFTPYEEYLEKFKLLYEAWQEDFPDYENIYLFQIRPGCGQQLYATGVIQEAQAEIARLNEDVEIISTTNMTHYSDNCHYNYADGYKLLGEKVCRYLNHRQYGSPDTAGMRSPRITSAYVTEQNLVNLVVDDPDPLLFDRSAMNDFFLNKSNQKPSDIAFFDHTIQLFFRVKPGPEETVSYCGHQGNKDPAITNKYNNGLLSFFSTKILNPSLPDPLPAGSFADPVTCYFSGGKMMIYSKGKDVIPGTFSIADITGRPVKKENINIFEGLNSFDLPLAVHELFIVDITLDASDGKIYKKLKVLK